MHTMSMSHDMSDISSDDGGEKGRQMERMDGQMGGFETSI
jgi:hypothetical protein